MRDTADYWIKPNGEPFTIRFPAKVHRKGKFDRTGPYFNMTHTGLDIAALKRARAQFELTFLTQDDDCPAKSIRQSSNTLSTLMLIHARHDNTLPPAKRSENGVCITAFWHSYGISEGDYFSLVIITEPLFRHIPAG
ncbi:hypothetical protein JVT61DRAFT_1874 [Boletus reticuloceps]|uniref:Uncharacterized protein n=1 Tax=Boletus reticuloceps TaxID=495285 RepID=A0A8I2YBX1_9AGAM|nr:hypothetical protein JVT61DRAFT_1874 [Boletus reticuloceps]